MTATIEQLLRSFFASATVPVPQDDEVERTANLILAAIRMSSEEEIARLFAEEDGDDWKNHLDRARRVLNKLRTFK